MSQEYLDFELPIAELEAKIEALRAASDDKVDLTDEIKRLQKKSNELTIFLLNLKNLRAIVHLLMIKRSLAVLHV